MALDGQPNQRRTPVASGSLEEQAHSLGSGRTGPEERRLVRLELCGWSANEETEAEPQG